MRPGLIYSIERLLTARFRFTTSRLRKRCADIEPSRIRQAGDALGPEYGSGSCRWMERASMITGVLALSVFANRRACGRPWEGERPARTSGRLTTTAQEKRSRLLNPTRPARPASILRPRPRPATVSSLNLPSRAHQYQILLVGCAAASVGLRTRSFPVLAPRTSAGPVARHPERERHDESCPAKHRLVCCIEYQNARMQARRLR